MMPSRSISAAVVKTSAKAGKVLDAGSGIGSASKKARNAISPQWKVWIPGRSSHQEKRGLNPPSMKRSIREVPSMILKNFSFGIGRSPIHAGSPFLFPPICVQAR